MVLFLFLVFAFVALLLSHFAYTCILFALAPCCYHVWHLVCSHTLPLSSLAYFCTLLLLHLALLTITPCLFSRLVVFTPCLFTLTYSRLTLTLYYFVPCSCALLSCLVELLSHLVMLFLHLATYCSRFCALLLFVNVSFKPLNPFVYKLFFLFSFFVSFDQRFY
jgi:hypothetical protein